MDTFLKLSTLFKFSIVGFLLLFCLPETAFALSSDYTVSCSCPHYVKGNVVILTTENRIDGWELYINDSRCSCNTGSEQSSDFVSPTITIPPKSQKTVSLQCDGLLYFQQEPYQVLKSFDIPTPNKKLLDRAPNVKVRSNLNKKYIANHKSINCKKMRLHKEKENGIVRYICKNKRPRQSKSFSVS